MAEKHEKHAGGRTYWLDKERNINILVYALYLACAAIVIADLFFVKHPHFNPENIFNFYGFYGFVCFVFIVFAGKALRALVMRDEDYYDD